MNLARTTLPLSFVALAGIASAQSQLSTSPHGPAHHTPATPMTLGAPTASTPSDIVVTQNASQAITPFNSISCNDGVIGLHADNWYYRVFDVSGLGGDLEIQSVDLGIETATSSGGTQPVRVRVYDSGDLNDTLIDANIVHESTEAVADQSATILNIPVSGTIASGSMIVEVFTPNGQGTGESFFIGSNADGETGPSYIRADDCGISIPTALGSIGFPDMHIVLGVNGKLADPCLPDDAFDNDTCSGAEVITDGTFPGLRAFKADVAPDWFNFLLSPGETAVVDASFVHASGNVDLALYGDCAGSLLDASQGTTDTEQVSYTNNLPVTISLFLEVALEAGDAADCNDYELTLTTFPPCTFDDDLEGNDTCFDAEVIVDGSYADLVAFKQGVAADWFNFVVAPGEGVKLDVLFSHADGNIDARLYQDCSGTLLASGESTTDDESVQFVNTLGVTLSVFLEVYVEGSDLEDCNLYTLVATTTRGPGENYCTSVVNSSGEAGTLTATGSNSVAVDSLVLTAEGIPNSFALFYFGPNQIQAPFNNGGFQCVGGLIQRLQPPTQASGNSVSKTVLPGPFTFLSGTTANFQCWFRDQNVLPDRSNTTNGYTVTFVD